MERKERRRAEAEARRQAEIARRAEEKRQRDAKLAAQRAAAEAKKVEARAMTAPRPAVRPVAPLPPVPVTVRPPRLEFQETAFAQGDLDAFTRRERAALWWVSNQSDDLLCLPHCRRLDADARLRAA